MRWSSRIKTALVLWCLAEALVFGLLVHFFGLGAVLITELVTGMVGVMLLKRTGATTLMMLRDSFQGSGGAGGDVLDGGLSVLGALAILLPGFLSDLIGLVLLNQPLRARVAGVLGGKGWIWGRRGGRSGQPGVVDLTPDEWRSVDGRGTSELRRP